MKKTQLASINRRLGTVVVAAAILVGLVASTKAAYARPVVLRLGGGVSAGPTLQTSISQAQVATHADGVVLVDAAIVVNRHLRWGLRGGLQPVRTKGIGKEMCSLWVGPMLEGGLTIRGVRWHTAMAVLYQRLANGRFFPSLFSPMRHGLGIAANVGATFAVAERLKLRGEIGARGQPWGRYFGHGLTHELTHGFTPYGAIMVELAQ